jgi:indole-3-glycerol phosphate synthase
MSILSTILEHTRQDLLVSKQLISPKAICQLAMAVPPKGGFADALRVPADGTRSNPRVISEVKHASPSRGIIRQDFRPLSLALELEQAGAAALSVLTDVRHFQGHPDYLRAAAANVSIPVLRKDFIVDPYQLYEARLWGASAVLLIAAALPEDEFRDLHALATELGLDVLCEVHNEPELAKVLGAEAKVIGVNSRDLKTFRTDLNAAAHLLSQIPEGIVRVAESGIRSAADMQGLQRQGTHAFLIGETLMKEDSPGDKLRELLAEAAEPAESAIQEPTTKFFQDRQP